MFGIHARELRQFDGTDAEFLQSLANIVAGAARQFAAADQQKLLVREMAHRAGNMLQLVNSIANQTFGAEADLRLAKKSFSDRLNSLARSNYVVARGGWIYVGLTGDGDLADPRSLQVWRASGEGCLVVSQDQAPSSVVVYPPAAGPVDVSITWQRGAWFAQSIAVLVLGMLLLAGAGWWLRRGPQPTGSGEVLDPSALESGLRHDDEETTR